MGLSKLRRNESLTLRDRKGRMFTLAASLDEETAYYRKLSYGSWRVGYAYCSFDGKVMRLNDILVDDDVVLPPRTLLHALWRILSKPKPLEMRGQGLGTAMLQQVVEETHARGAERIVGLVTPEDRRNNPELLAWYAKHGFVALEQPDKTVGQWQEIVLTLRPVLVSVALFMVPTLLIPL